MNMPEAGSPGVENGPDIDWDNQARHPVALTLLSRHDGGTIIAYRNADRRLYGCRDVSAGKKHDDTVAAWVASATAAGLVIDDRRVEGGVSAPA